MSQVYTGREQIRCAPDAPMLAIGVPIRNVGPAEFWITLNQAIPPLNVKIAYIIQKGMLAAAARNEIIRTCLAKSIRYVIFLDDDVLIPDVALYRLWVTLQLHPEAAAITGIYPSKIEPPEPMLYSAMGNGAFWDWSLGDLVPIHSAGAGCMIVDLEYVQKLTPPWFQDTVVTEKETDGVASKASIGHDRYFLARLTSEAGGVVYADTGLLLAHMEPATGKLFLLAQAAPCFQRPVKGEAFVPGIEADGRVTWTRIVPTDSDPEFCGYLRWLAQKTTQDRAVVLIPDATVTLPAYDVTNEVAS